MEYIKRSTYIFPLVIMIAVAAVSFFGYRYFRDYENLVLTDLGIKELYGRRIPVFTSEFKRDSGLELLTGKLGFDGSITLIVSSPMDVSLMDRRSRIAANSLQSSGFRLPELKDNLMKFCRISFIEKAHRSSRDVTYKVTYSDGILPTLITYRVEDCLPEQ